MGSIGRYGTIFADRAGRHQESHPGMVAEEERKKYQEDEGVETELEIREISWHGNQGS